MPQPTRDQVFISYSHKDRDWLGKLRSRSFKKIQLLLGMTQIQAGDQWRNQIAEALQNARVAVLLISPDFLAFDFIADHECRRLGRGLAHSGFGLVSGG
jgi:hypothetical protein